MQLPHYGESWACLIEPLVSTAFIFDSQMHEKCPQYTQENQQYSLGLNQSPEPIIIRQYFGLVVAVILFLLGMVESAMCILKISKLGFNSKTTLNYGLLVLSWNFSSIFYCMIIFKKEYLKGNPNIWKMWPLVVSSLVKMIHDSLIFVTNRILEKIFITLAIQCIFLAISYFMLFGDDNYRSCFLYFKPYMAEYPPMGAISIQGSQTRDQQISKAVHIVLMRLGMGVSPLRIAEVHTFKMYHQPQISHQYSQYPQVLNKSIEPVAEKQCFGYTMSIIYLIISLISITTNFTLASLVVDFHVSAIYGLFAIASVFSCIFYGTIIKNESYLKGKPKFYKMWPLIVASLCRMISYTIFSLYFDAIIVIFVSLIGEVIGLALSFLMYFSDDKSGSCCLFFKPFTFRAPVLIFAPNYDYSPQAFAPELNPPQYQHLYPPRQSNEYPEQQQQQKQLNKV